MVSSFEWIEDGDLSKNHKIYLKTLLLNKPDFENSYVSRKLLVGKPALHENEFKDRSVIYESMNYLGLTRYWNIINYYFPYRELIPENWSLTYYQMVPEFTNAKNYREYTLATIKLSSKIKDAHGFVFGHPNPHTESLYPPFWCITVEEGTFISHVDSLGAPFKRHDQIIEIDGVSTKDRWDYVSSVVSVSNRNKLKVYSSKFLMTSKDSIKIKVKRGESFIEAIVPTISLNTIFPKSKEKPAPSKDLCPYEIRIDSVSGKSYTYVNMGKLKRKDIKRRFARTVRKTDYLIIDSRNYPNLTLGPLSKFLLNDQQVAHHFTEINFDQPGTLKRVVHSKFGGKGKGYQGQVYILVDHRTLSQAEFTVMILQNHPNSTTIGSQTAGADGDIVRITMPYDLITGFSGLGVFYPDGTPTQQIGIKIDIPVNYHIQDLKGVDSIMESALELIRN